jgi:hypothetical protein
MKMQWWEWVILALFAYGLYWVLSSLYEKNQEVSAQCQKLGGHMTRYDGCVQGRRLM